MATGLPSKDLLLNACSGTVVQQHPLLEAAYELAGLHEARYRAEPAELLEIDCARARLIHDIDRWTAQNLPRPLAAAALHTETLGMVVDRLARFSVDAHNTLDGSISECRSHYAWRRLAELALAYGDLTHDLTARTRRIPDSVAPHPKDLRGQQI